MNETKYLDLLQISRKLMKEYGKGVQDLSADLEPSNWAKEAFDLAKEFAYPLFFKSNQVTLEY